MLTTNQKAKKLLSIVYLRTWPSNVWTMGFFLMTVLSIFEAKVLTGDNNTSNRRG